jgi:hypothetical protein
LAGGSADHISRNWTRTNADEENHIFTHIIGNTHVRNGSNAWHRSVGAILVVAHDADSVCHVRFEYDDMLSYIAFFIIIL